MKTHKIQFLATESGVGGGGQWRPSSQHISGFLDDVTLSKALDRVLDTFPGIWAYQNCPLKGQRERAVYFRFFYLRNLGAGAFVED